MAGQEKTEKPTAQRLREARARGDIPTSPELTGSVVAIIGLVVLQQQGSHIMAGLLALLSRDLVAAGGASGMTGSSVFGRIGGDAATGLLLLVPIVAATALGGVAICLVKTRGLLSLKPLAPSLRKLNPANGVKHLVSRESLILLLKTLMKLAVVTVVVSAWSPAWQALVPGLAIVPVVSGIGQVWQDCVQAAVQIVAAFLVIGGLDMGYRHFAWYQRMRMTRMEIAEEYKRSEGNPHMRSRMRQTARKRLKALLNGASLRRVPQADVVVTNPTHFAVAVQYKPGTMRAPKVVAKGQRLVALHIKETARKHNVPIVENKPLAQALFKSVEVNQEIPADLYQAVAQVLAFVYRMRQRAVGSGQWAVGSGQWAVGSGRKAVGR